MNEFMNTDRVWKIVQRLNLSNIDHKVWYTYHHNSSYEFKGGKDEKQKNSYNVVSYIFISFIF